VQPSMQRSCVQPRRFPSDEDGALTPMLLAFLGITLLALGFFVQVGHGSVLARGASTAADAAALAAAGEYQDAWGQYVSWYRRCTIPQGLGGSCPEGPVPPLPSTGPCPSGVRAAAQDYAGRNDATLTDCRITRASLASGIEVSASIRGRTGPMDGPVRGVSGDRPTASASASVPVPPGVANVLQLIDGWRAEIEDALDDDSCDDVDEADEDEEPCEPPTPPGPPAGLDALMDGVRDATVVRLTE
jgi:hypothetical protein